METKTITKADLNEQNEYAASDSLEFDGHIQIQGNLGRVVFRGRLQATGFIRSLAGTGIEAGTGITCKTLAVRLRIFAGLCMWRKPKPEEMEIRAESISGEVCFGTVKLTGPGSEKKEEEKTKCQS